MSNLSKEVAKRRTFAIISHPDAGKTTITEKMLLFGNAIQMAGSVKSKRDDRQERDDGDARPDGREPEHPTILHQIAAGRDRPRRGAVRRGESSSVPPARAGGEPREGRWSATTG